MSSLKVLKNKKIGVLMGGWSSEREISLKTGRAIEQALAEEGFKVKGIDVDRNIAARLRKENIDLAFIALHGAYGEDGKIQSLLEILGIPYTGSGVLGSALAMDKVKAKEIFAFHKIPTPRWEVLKRNRKVEDREQLKIIKEFGLPLVVKPSDQGSTVGISIVGKKEGLRKAFREAWCYTDKVIIEEYIPGMEITVGIIGNSPLPVMEIVPKRRFYDFSAKYIDGMAEHVIPACLPSSYLLNAQKLALRAHQSLECSGVTRVDLRVKKNAKGWGKMYVLEVNTIPGMTRISLLPEAARAVGIGFNQLVLEILRLATSKSS
ncbi:MAG: D-alanine--D-alanine ligase [bacterium]